MDFELSEEHNLLRETIRDFAENEIAPGAIERDKTHEFPHDIIKKMAALGLMGVPFPEEYGGSGGDTISYAIAVEEISRVDGSLGLTLAAHTSLGASPFYLFGTEEQKRKYLVPQARGEMIGAFGLTEPQAGSDAGGTKTVAVRDNGEWVINGSKLYMTSGRIAGVMVITAKTDPTATGSRGITSFIVEGDTPGVTFGKDEDKMGLRSSITSPVFFENVRVPAENMLGGEGEGFKEFLEILDGGRISIGAMAVGLGQAALDAAIRYSNEREQFGQPISNFQAVQFMLADMATKLEAARLMVYQAAWVKDQKRPFTKQAAMCKLFASEVGEECCHKAIQVHGGFGYITEAQVERYYRDVRLTEIGEGTSEIQRIVIARELLKEAKKGVPAGVA
ncbi:MAG TPA: acyl-CoA dehydrogenase [Chloroflexia bacterium]|jgi:alkylation response protein AidB-like acyl-CoA dehydrogenase